MSIVDILPLIFVVLFWIALFGFTFWFSRAALRSPTEAELELQHADSGHTH